MPTTATAAKGQLTEQETTTMLAEGDDTCIMAATFARHDEHIDGKFLVIPVPVIANIAG